MCACVRAPYHSFIENLWVEFFSLLLRRECCSFSNGEYVKAGLAELEQWCYDATEEVSSTIVFSHAYQFISHFMDYYFPSVCRLSMG